MSVQTGQPEGPEASGRRPLSRCLFAGSDEQIVFCTAVRDCSSCKYWLQSKWANRVNWVCFSCAVGRHDAWPGARVDEFIPSAYRSGDCDRCGQPRMLLMAVKKQ